MRQTLVMDFDGVISDSAREAFAVALRSYLDLRPESPLRRHAAGDHTTGHSPDSVLYRSFLDLMPLGNRAEDYGTVLAAIESNTDLPDQPAYDAFRAAQDPDWLRRYHRRFYEVRSAMAETDPEGWRSLMRPYEPLLEILRRHAGRVTYAIATSKDRASVEVLLRAYGIAELIPMERVMDKEVGARKSVHLERLHERLGVDWGAMAFIDDKVNHLDSVAPLGVRCVLAAWGYNGKREWELAEGRGYLVCTLENLEGTVFELCDS